MKRKSRLQELRESLPAGFGVDSYGPGDGVTRYRFFASEPVEYFAGRGIYTALGIAEAEVFASGLGQGYLFGQMRKGKEIE